MSLREIVSACGAVGIKSNCNTVDVVVRQCPLEGTKLTVPNIPQWGGRVRRMVELPRLAGRRQRVDSVRAFTIPSNNLQQCSLLAEIRQCLVDNVRYAVPHNPLGVGVVFFLNRMIVAFFGLG